MASVVKEVVVAAPTGRVFSYWKNFENFPQFMENIEKIESIGPDETRWTLKGPLGTPVVWEAKTTYVEENKKIAWVTTEGQIETHGAVIFEEVGADSTNVRVGLEYTVTTGAVGEFFGKLLGDPEKKLEEDLARFKTIAETHGFGGQA